MIFKDDLEVIGYVKKNQAVPEWVTRSRNYNVELCALVNGEGFDKELINRIEKIESSAKAEVRKKYARNITDFFERLFLPIQNVFASTGGVKNYRNGEYKMSEENQKKLLASISNVRDGKSIERYIETQWMNLYHTDPSGVLWMQYTTNDSKVKVYPTYQCIGNIRTYIPNGQIVECILFEPYTVENKKYWIVVDDAKQYTVIQDGETYVISSDPLKTFEHPFGTVPVIINSNIVDKLGNRLSPIHKIIPVAKEYARDQSIKTLYKFLQGFPKHWRRGMICKACAGTRKNGDNACPSCNGKGEIMKVDVADEAVLPMPENGDPVLKGDDIMGFTSPDIKTWEQFNNELEWLECSANETMWGVEAVSQVEKTATEVYQDQQPKITKLGKYADVCEWIEWKITEWIANAIDTAKDKEKAISLIVYGRRYILEGIDTIQKKYEDAKKNGENTIVLDGIFDELLTVKFKNDAEWMAQELKKAACEPYLHYSAIEINDMFGSTEAAKKVYFQRWWKNLTDQDLKTETKVLQQKFETDFTAYFKTLIITQPINKQFNQPV